MESLYKSCQVRLKRSVLIVLRTMSQSFGNQRPASILMTVRKGPASPSCFVLTASKRFVVSSCVTADSLPEGGQRPQRLLLPRRGRRVRSGRGRSAGRVCRVWARFHCARLSARTPARRGARERRPCGRRGVSGVLGSTPPCSLGRSMSPWSSSFWAWSCPCCHRGR